jgi:KaiC/GvpD/RAD55 family RecA-like ATPase
LEKATRSTLRPSWPNDQLIAHGEAFGWPFKAAVESGLLRIRHLEPVEISLDAVGAELRAASLGESRVQRVVVDSLAELEPAARGTARFPDYLTALTGLFASIGATTLLTSETTAFFGPAFELPQGLAFVADNVILLRYAELESEVRPRGRQAARRRPHQEPARGRDHEERHDRDREVLRPHRCTGRKPDADTAAGGPATRGQLEVRGIGGPP